MVTGPSASLTRWPLVATTTLLAPGECAGDKGRARSHPRLSPQDGSSPLTQKKCRTRARGPARTDPRPHAGRARHPEGPARTAGLPPRQRPDAHTARADCIPDRPHEGPPPPGLLTRRTPTQRPDGPGNQHHLGGHIRPCSPAAPGTRLRRPPAGVCMCDKERPSLGPEPCPHRAATPPHHPHQAPALSPGRRPPATARPSYLERWGMDAVPAGHPVAFSADSSWEGMPRSGQHPDHHRDIQAWGSPTAIAAGCGPGVGGAGGVFPRVPDSDSQSNVPEPLRGSRDQSKLPSWR